MCKIDTTHGNRIRILLSYHRLIGGSVLFMAVVVTVLYSAIYTAQLAVPIFNPLVKSIDDVAANPAIKVFVASGSSVNAIVMVRLYK